MTVNWPLRSRIRNPNDVARSSRPASRLRACWIVPWPVGITGGAEDVDVAAVDFDDEEAVAPAERNGAVDVEEVAGHHRWCLSLQGLPSAYVGLAVSCWRDAEPFEDPVDG